MKAILILPILALASCSTTEVVDPNRPLTAADNGKVINERIYETNGVRKRERRILVTTTPKLETPLETVILP